MKEIYLFHAQISESLNSKDIWSLCLPIIEQFSESMGESYHVCCGAPDFSVNIAPSEISRLLAAHENSSYPYLITWRNKEFETMQGFSYFGKEKSLSFSFSQQLVSLPLDAFGASIANVLPLVNMLVQQQSYLMPLRKYRNPGHNNLFIAPCYHNGREGYIEGVSAEMWLGEPFWQYAACSKEDILKQDWLHCEDLTSHLYVRASPAPFSSAEGEQGETQRRLLDLLFGINGKTPPPFPPPPQSTFVQKVAVDGKKVKDLGMEEVRPDGRRGQISPPGPPPLPDSDEVILERTIRAINEQPWIGEAVLFTVMLSTKGFLVIPDPGKPDQFATVRHLESGEEMLVCYTSEKFVKAAGEKVGITTSHVTYGPFLDVFKECKGDLGIILNPATDVTIAISAASAKTAGEIAAQNHNQCD